MKNVRIKKYKWSKNKEFKGTKVRTAWKLWVVKNKKDKNPEMLRLYVSFEFHADINLNCSGTEQDCMWY